MIKSKQNYLVLLFLAISVLEVSGAGQCWYCSQVLHNQICAKAQMFDGYCTWSNNRCMTRSNQPKKSLQTILTAFKKVTKYRCYQLATSSCIGLDGPYTGSICAVDPSTNSCAAVTPSNGCSSQNAKWKCEASAASHGCAWTNGRCQTDSCSLWPSSSCYYRISYNLQKYPCGWYNSRCTDISVSQIQQNVCVAMSLLMGFPVQIDPYGYCKECYGSYPSLLKLIYPLSRRRILLKHNV